MILILKPRLLRLIAGYTILLASIVLVAGCGKPDDDASDAAATSNQTASAPNATGSAPDLASTATITTGPGQQQADNQVDFFIEGYLRSEERLKRRQERLRALLAQ